MLDKYRDAIHMTLWPRFQVVVDMHIESVRKAKTKIKPKNVHPHWASESAVSPRTVPVLWAAVRGLTSTLLPLLVPRRLREDMESLQVRF